MILPQPAGLKYSLALLASLVLFIFPANVFAEKAITEEWQISADKISRYDNPESIIAEGNIELIKREKVPPKPPEKSLNVTNWSVLLEEKPAKEEKTPKDLAVAKGEPTIETKVTIKADWMAYDVTLGTIKARGHVDIVTDDEHLVAEQAVVNLTRDTGTFTNATITRKQNELHLEGKTVEKTGVRTYHIVDGWVITCKLANGETPPWSFSSKDTSITQGGYAVLKNATFDIKGVPVFYTPYMALPAKNSRETGLLYPEFSASTNNGYGFNIPFFYNISDSADMTIFSEYYTKRGFMPGLEFRYVLKADDKGTFAASFLNDRLSDPSETKYYSSTGFTHTNNDRYWIRGKIDKTISEWVTRIDLDIVSDRDYLTEFNSGGYTGFAKSNDRFRDIYGRGFQDKTDDQRQNSVSILKSWAGTSFVTDFTAIDDVRITKSSPTPLWKLPGMDYTGATPIGESDFNFNWDANYVNYWRQDGVGGQRIDIHPKVSTPIPLGPYLESRAEVGARETYYGVQTYGDGAWDQGNSPNRTLYDLHTEVGTTLARDFDIQINDNKGITHKLRPYVQYDYIPKKDQTYLPSFDSIDRIDPANTITYGVDNFFNLFKDAKLSDSKPKNDYVYFKIKQSYYLDDIRKSILVDSNNNTLPTDETDKPLSPVNMKLGWTPNSDQAFIYKTDLDAYGHGLISHTVESSYKNDAGQILDIDYRYSKYLDIQQINVHAKTPLFYNFRGEVLVSHSLSQSETNEEDISLVYQAPCWSVDLRYMQSPTDKGVMLIFTLANIGSKMGMSL
jgi:LPS-assembly protein